MFKAVKETDKYGKIQTHFYLTQGDTCVIRSTPYKDGQKLATDQIEKCLFKLSDTEYVEQFQKEMVLEDDKFVLRLSTDETSKLAIETHMYEIEYTLLGGAVNTPNQWKFDITDQIYQ